MVSDKEHVARCKEKLICPECEKEGSKSRVFFSVLETKYPRFNSRSCHPFYDEEGVYHLHRQATTTQSYLCSNGHSFSIQIINRCPNPECDWVQEE